MTVKLTDKHLRIFDRAVRRWVKRLKLDDWEFHVAMGGVHKSNRAELEYDVLGAVATFSLTDEWNDEVTGPTKAEVESCAKHEALHLLCAELEVLARSRYVTKDEVDRASEHLVRKLEWLILDKHFTRGRERR